MRSPSAWLTACSCALVLAACGGGNRSTAGPKLPLSLVDELASYSDQIAAHLSDGDTCGARDLARELQRRTITDISIVPTSLQEPLQSSVNDLVARIHCATPAPPPGDEGVMRGSDKHRDHGKHGHGKKHGGGD